MTVHEPHTCSRCGAPLTDEQARADTCPSCLLGLGLAEPGDEELPTSDPTPDTSDLPDRIGPYHIIRSLGEGGMGEVFLAEQRVPIHRYVALKVIKRGMDTRAVIARFEAERQALALMDHPAIAKVLEAGETPAGRPFFAMDYVDGAAITNYCDEQRLPIRDRIDLLIKVCEGVQHAHQKGIIHRDLKPTNVLVTIQDGAPVPKIIDFGVAKAIEQRLTERTLFTELGLLVGTPEYMSPEQAEMSALDVDTRTDVYALGVMLYELLTGVLPFDTIRLREAGFDEIRRRIREDEPSRPSARLSTLGERSTDSARRRRVDVPTLTRELQGDLDWITLRALEKDRERRYGSPSELALDLRCHLSDEPVGARPPSTAYRARKFVRRNKLLVSSLTAIFLLLVGGVVTSTTFGLREARQRREADRARDDLQKVVEFQSSMLADVEPEAMGRRVIDDLRDRGEDAGRNSGATEGEVEAALRSFDSFVSGINLTDAALRIIDEEILGPAGETLTEEFADQPLTQAYLHLTLGLTYDRLGMLDAAEARSERALAIRRERRGDEHPATLEAANTLAMIYARQSRWDEAEELLEETVEVARRALDPEDRIALLTAAHLAALNRKRGRFDQAESMLVEVIEAQRRTLGPRHADTLGAMDNLALTYVRMGRYGEAEELLRELMRIREELGGADNPKTLQIKANLASLYIDKGEFDAARTMLLELLDQTTRVLGSEHPETRGTGALLSKLYLNLRRYDEAEPLARELLATYRRDLGADHDATLAMMNNLAVVLSETRRFDEAESLYLDGLSLLQAKFGDRDPRIGAAKANIAAFYFRQGRHDEAESMAVEAVSDAESILGMDHPSTIAIRNTLAVVYEGQGRLADAERIHEQIIETAQRVLGDEHPTTLISSSNLGQVYKRQGRYAEAEALFQGVLEIRERVLGSDDVITLRSIYNLATVAALDGRTDDAMVLLRDTVGRGFENDLIFRDGALDSLRGHPEFEELAEQVRRRRERP